jgi:tRNA threonylcarbamoyl adenosine modification protein YeaZ
MRILSFDTSASELHLSLLTDKEPVYERVLGSASNERQEVASLLMPEIARGFEEVGWKKSELDAVVVGIGPGSFTGIRVSVITGRSICQILKLPLIGVSLLEAHYYSLGIDDPAAVIVGSTPPQCFHGVFQRTADDPASALLPPAVARAEVIAEALKDFPTWYADEKASASLGNADVLPLPKLKNVGTIQAQLAWDRVSLRDLSAETFAWQKVLPLYLRSPSVTLKRNYAPANPANESR